jgi:predicted nucleotidyltransferase
MGKTPDKPEMIFPQITSDCQQIFGDDLISIILYGSGASGHYVPGKSDLNFLVILTDRGMENLEKAIDAVARWRKSRVAVPLCMTGDYICSSLDAYPIEFLDMKLHHVLVYGKDIFAEIEIQPGHLRLQIERELRGKILHLRKRFLDTEGKEKPLRELIKVSLTAFLATFKAMLFLLGVDVPRERREIITAAARSVGVDDAVFMKCMAIREGTDKYSKTEILDIYKDYMKEIDKLCRRVDELKVTP